METLVEKMIQSPKLPNYLAEIQDFWAKEQQKRKQFYEQIEENKKMEFINGEIYFQSPVKLRHGNAANLLFNLLFNYVLTHDLGQLGYEKLLVSLTRNDYEPDICFWRKKISQHFLPTQMQFPAPDLVVEVLSPSTEKHDREVKFEDYANHGVNEYWIIDAEKQVIEQYINENNIYQLKHKAEGKEIIFCQTLVGFNIPANVVFDENENMKFLKTLI
ncbi:MAG: Uma2 family endonuclease [Verrucomicrobia bacterium]|nr:Uma2 family endonuclease [Cytophagales bacterium]